MKSIILPLAVVASLASGNMNSDNQDVRHPYEPIKTVENVCVEHKGVLDNYFYDGQVIVNHNESIESTGNRGTFTGIGDNPRGALEDALLRASENFHGANIRSKTIMKDYLADDSVDVYSNGAISRAKVVDTNHDDGLYRVKIEAEEGRGYCPTNLD